MTPISAAQYCRISCIKAKKKGKIRQHTKAQERCFSENDVVYVRELLSRVKMVIPPTVVDPRGPVPVIASCNMVKLCKAC